MKPPTKEVERPAPGGFGLMTCVIPVSFSEKEAQAARKTVRKELKKTTGRNVIDPSKVYDRVVVRSLGAYTLCSAAK